jgi:filamentous hemagglutinin family protein
MKILQQNYLRKAIATFLLTIISAVCVPQNAIAQIIPDATLPNPSVVVNTNPLFTITGGTTANSNLFHSFSQFSLHTGTEAFFNSSALIQNILVRVTGNSISNIDGLIRANAPANLFLINPNGIVFGQNARLNIGGSFLTTTANSVRFLDGSEFRAEANTQTTSPLLLVSAPIGLQFNGLTNGAIFAQGLGNGLGYSPNPNNFGVFRPGNPSLNVQSGRTLALVGGDVILQGANLTADSGRIELGSVAGNGFVAIAPIANGWLLNYDNTPNLGNIRLEQAAMADTSGINGGGNIQLQGRQVTLDGGSALLSSSLGNGNGSEVFVRATELFTVIRASNFGVPSGIFTGAGANSSGTGSNITIAAKRVELTNGGTIGASTVGSGKGGDIRINASDILVTGKSIFEGSFITTGVYNSTATDNSGNIIAGKGNSGNITITTDNLLFSEYALLNAGTFGEGNAGNIKITAKNINLINTSSMGGNYETLIGNTAFAGSRGNGGVIKINTDNLQMTGTSLLAASTFGIGNAGKIDITAKSILLDSSSSSNSFNSTLIFNGSNENATGNGGSLEIKTDSLVLKNGGQISVGTSTRNSGNAGNLLINAKFIDIFGTNNTFRSGLFANALLGSGNGGNIEVTSDRLIVRDRGVISASNFVDQRISTQTVRSGSGPVGSITINSPSILLDQGSINIDSLSGSRGNINLNSNLILLRNGSTISTNAIGNAIGGNNVINTDFLVAVPTENSDITANSVNSFGGRNIITTKGLIGFQTGNRLTQLSDITAASSLGTQFNGLVEIRSPDTDLSRGLVKLPDNLTDANKKIVAACDRLRGNEFIVTGRGGVPSDATKVISSQAIWRDLRLSEIPSIPSNTTAQMTSNPVATQSVPTQPFPKIEAQGWEKSANGNLKLLAYADAPPVWRSPVICQDNNVRN